MYLWQLKVLLPHLPGQHLLFWISQPFQSYPFSVSPSLSSCAFYPSTSKPPFLPYGVPFPVFKDCPLLQLLGVPALQLSGLTFLPSPRIRSVHPSSKLKPPSFRSLPTPEPSLSVAVLGARVYLLFYKQPVQLLHHCEKWSLLALLVPAAVGDFSYGLYFKGRATGSCYHCPVSGITTQELKEDCSYYLVSLHFLFPMFLSRKGHTTYVWMLYALPYGLI